MKHAVLLITLWVSLGSSTSMAGLEPLFPPSLDLDGVSLERKGVSQLTVGYIFKVYVAAFYQTARQGPDDALSDQPRHLEISYLRDIAKDDFLDAAEDMLSKQHPPEKIEAIRPGIQQINGLYQDVRKGDRYSLTYRPGVGTELRFNGEIRGVIPGREFAHVYFSIWLGEQHPYRAFRDRLVGLE